MSDFIAERIGPDARIERSIFGADDPEAMWDHVLGASARPRLGSGTPTRRAESP